MSYTPIEYASFLRIDDSSKIKASHLNASKDGGHGWQHLSDVSIRTHHHVNKSLLIAMFPTFETTYSEAFSNTLIDNQNFSFSGTHELFARSTTNWMSGGRWGSENPFGSVVDFPADFSWLSGDNVAKSKSFDYTPISDNSPLTGDDLAAQNYGFLDVQTDDVTSPDYRIVYGLFANEIFVDNILLTSDVGGNATFSGHLRDFSIHRTVLPPVTIVSENDYMYGFHGSINLYPTKLSTSVDYPTGLTRMDDDYPLNSFAETSEYYDLEKVGAAKDSGGNLQNNISHPMLYEEGIYMWNAYKVKQYKMIKADPDSVHLANARKRALPMDSLFIGSGIEVGLTEEKFKIAPGSEHSSIVWNDRTGYKPTINTNLDSYMYNNFYFTGVNREYKIASEKHIIESLWNSGLGYAPFWGIGSMV